MEALDIEEGEHWRSLAGIKLVELDKIIEELQINGAVASPGARSKMALVGHIARILAGLEESVERKRKREELDDAVKKKTIHGSSGKIALSEISNQMSKDEVDPIDQDQVDHFFETLHKRQGGRYRGPCR